MNYNSDCIDCGLNTFPKPKKRNGQATHYSRVGRCESYMVHPKIWKAAGLAQDDGHLCVGCLEKRLGRRLLPNDFTDAPINTLRSSDTKRLMARRLGLSDDELWVIRTILRAS